MIRLLLVDDHEMVRAGLRTLLARVPDLEVVGEAASAAAAIAESARTVPDVVLMDLRLPDGSGVEACREILSTQPGVKVLFLTSYAEDLARTSTALAGASGYLLKDIGYGSLVEAIRTAASGGVVTERAPGAALADVLKKATALSNQERRVLAQVVEGKTNKEIGATLGLSEKTVRNYLSNAFQKLGVSRRSQAAVLFSRGEPDRS